MNVFNFSCSLTKIYFIIYQNSVFLLLLTLVYFFKLRNIFNLKWLTCCLFIYLGKQIYQNAWPILIFKWKFYQYDGNILLIIQQNIIFIISYVIQRFKPLEGRWSTFILLKFNQDVYQNFFFFKNCVYDFSEKRRSAQKFPFF